MRCSRGWLRPDMPAFCLMWASRLLTRCRALFTHFHNTAVFKTPIRPTGRSKYDSLQIKATKRFSHGLQAGGSYTWGQGFVEPKRQDFFNPQSAVWQLQQIPPQDLNFNAIYTVPGAAFLPKGCPHYAGERLADRLVR